MELRKATRKQAKLRIGISSPSGFGKTYSALLIAFGITGDWEKIAIIDTENGSGELYSHLGDYNALPLEAPYSPERYIEAIKACEAAGMEVIIIDSISHEWEGSGGVLELADNIGGGFQSAWKMLTPRHEKFKQAILTSKCHVITTARRKQDYILQETTNRNGKTVQAPVKAGFKEVTREGWEYELTVNLEIVNANHFAKASKDRTELFSDKPEFIITQETGQQLKEWAETGLSTLDIALKEVEACDSEACTTRVWHKYPQLKQTEAFVNAVKAKGSSFKKVEEEEEEPSAFASTKQRELLIELLNSHHIPDSYREEKLQLTVQENEISLSDFQQVYNEVDAMIKEGTDFEKTNPATSDQVAQIQQLLDNDVISPDEATRGRAKLSKGYSIALAHKVIKNLLETVDEREKQMA